MQSAPALGPGSLISERARVLELVFHDPFYVVYSAESAASGARIGVTEYFPADLVARAPSGDVLLRSLELQELFNIGRDRFMAEAKALAALQHPNLLHFDSVLFDHGTAFALHAAEEGQSITSLVRSSKEPPRQEEIDASVKQLISALDLLHSRNLIHANITPDTVLLRPDPLLVRFGATRSFLAARMRKVNLAVTPGYSAPELHFSDEKAHGPLCDIFSLAAVLYYVVTGRHPINVIARGLGHTMPPAAALPSQRFRPEFLEAIDRGLELEPERRPPTIKAFGEMLLGISEKNAPEGTQPALQMAANLTQNSQVQAAPSAAPKKGAASPAIKPPPRTPGPTPPVETDGDDDDEFDETSTFGSSWRGLGIGRLLLLAAVLALLIPAGLWLIEAQFKKPPAQSVNLDSATTGPSQSTKLSRSPSQDQPSQTDPKKLLGTARPAEQNAVAEAETRTAPLTKAEAEAEAEIKPSEASANQPAASVPIAPARNAATENPQAQELRVEAPGRTSSEADGTARLPASSAYERAKPSIDPVRPATPEKPETKATEQAAKPLPLDATQKRTFDPAPEQSPPLPATGMQEAAVEKLQAQDEAAPFSPSPATEKPVQDKVKVTKAEPVPLLPPGASASSLAGFRFTDCDLCPPLVVVPPGEFTMGSNERPHEKPVHKVRISYPFAIGQYEVTYGEWRSCVDAGVCRYRPEKEGLPHQAIGNLSWDDANTYLKWLSEKTGRVYRLPSEAEWEYAARAGSSRRFWWGEETGSGRANCSDCESETNGQPAVVGTYKPNAFGLYDTAGNIAEWVEDCWNESYQGAPTDGSPWRKGNCSLRGLRGGSYGNKATYIRSSSRFRYDSDVRYEANGFRVLRELR